MLSITTGEARAVVRRCRGSGVWACKEFSTTLNPRTLEVVPRPNIIFADVVPKSGKTAKTQSRIEMQGRSSNSGNGARESAQEENRRLAMQHESSFREDVNRELKVNDKLRKYVRWLRSTGCATRRHAGQFRFFSAGKLR